MQGERLVPHAYCQALFSAQKIGEEQAGSVQKLNFEPLHDAETCPNPNNFSNAIALIAGLLPGKPTDKGGRVADIRLFVEAVLYTARVGNPWRDLPREFGHWRSVYARFARWEAGGVWKRAAEALQNEADLEDLFIDSTVMRAHQHAAGAPKKTVVIRRSVGRAAG